MPDPKGIPSHRQFIDSVSDARLADFARRPTFSIDEPVMFETMRSHILQTLNSNVGAQGSFVDAKGQVFDFIPIEQQSSLRASGAKAAQPVSLNLPIMEMPTNARLVQPQLRAGQLDRFGNAMHCADGTIPVRRIALEEMTRFGNLQEFFRKSPVGVDRHPRLSPPQLNGQVHKYAHAYQEVANIGGHSVVSIWDPAVGSQVFSLAQQWCAGGKPLQTVECGWQVFPQKYQTTSPVLFVYWTADDYSATGAYNLDAPGFVQTSNSWALGSPLDAFSTDSGVQYELEITWQLIGRNWWLYLNGTDQTNAVGYYPASLYNGGQLATNATGIDFGGEVVNQTFWPPMGSGTFAAAGYGHAAYQREINYFDQAGRPQQPQLTSVQDSPNCYTIQAGVVQDTWGAHFYFGGPGGDACK